MTKIRILAGYVRPVFEQDLMGQIVPPEKARTQPFEIMCELEMPKRAISFLVTVAVPYAIVREEAAASAMAIRWLSQELPLMLAQRQGWDFFTPARLTLATAVEGNRVSDEFSADVELSVGLNAMAEAAADFIIATEAEFEKAKRALSKLVTENTVYGFQITVGEARRHFQQITLVLEASGSPFEDFDSRAARSAFADYQDLAKRKTENSHGYQTALSSLRTFVYCVSFPRVWGRRPQVLLS
jgi:hypothetical protein